MGTVIVLASASPRRKELLGRLGVGFVVAPSDIDETPRPGEAPVPYVERIARAKAAVAEGESVVAADTTVEVDGAILGKPSDDAEAKAMLARLGGRTHLVHTAVVVRHQERTVVAVETTEVDMAAMSDAELDWYVASGEPLDKAGAYGLQGIGGVFVTALRGCASNVIGLPLATTVALLREAGIDPTATS